MRPAVIAGVVMVTVWLQASLLGAMRPLGVVPNLLLVVIVIMALVATGLETVVAALAGGLALDLVSGSDLGLRVGFYALVALAAVSLRRFGADFDNLTPVLALVAGAGIIFNLAVLANLALAHQAFSVWLVTRSIMIETILNLTLAIALKLMVNPGRGSSGLSVGRRHG